VPGLTREVARAMIGRAFSAAGSIMLGIHPGRCPWAMIGRAFSAGGSRSSILDPQSSILNPQSSILYPQSSILDPPSSILYPLSSDRKDKVRQYIRWSLIPV
jgi:hypothetical protein